MRISWREVLGLLIGLGICYGLVTYALTNAPQIREIAQEQKKENLQRGATQQQTASTVSEENTKTVTVRVAGSKGEEFGGNIGNLRSSRSVEGAVPAEYEVTVRTDPLSGDYVSVTAWKNAENTKELKVQIIDDGRVIRESSTTKDYGATGVRWNPNEPQPSETTTSTEKKAGQDKKSRS
ncbi:MAG TPA: hypothetical protein VK361_06395 [Rubrobacteraceae bacterium]|nr:hypothetical protein [Rubrobacteraceae bacterium]